MDVLGCIEEPDDYVVSGTSDTQAHGMCEALWEPDMVKPIFVIIIP